MSDDKWLGWSVTGNAAPVEGAVVEIIIIKPTTRSPSVFLNLPNLAKRPPEVRVDFALGDSNSNQFSLQVNGGC